MNHPLIPAGAMYADIEHVEFDVRTMLDYDAAWLADRLVLTTHGGESSAYSAAHLPAEVRTRGDWDAVRTSEMHTEMRRAVIDNHLGLGYGSEIVGLSREIRDLKSLVAHLRRPIWRKALDKVVSWIEGIK